MIYATPERERARPPQSPAVVSACRATPLQWRYESDSDAPFPIRSVPDVNGALTRASLKPGEVFSVSAQQRSADGVIFLKLADGRGWVFDKIPSFSPVIVPYVDEGNIFDLDDACQDLCDESHVPSSVIQPRTASRRQVRGLIGALTSCWSCTGCDSSVFDQEPEAQTQLFVEQHVAPVPHLLGMKDALDITFTPRSDRRSRQTFTPRQLDFRDQIQLPVMSTLPVPPHCSPDEPEDVLRRKLFEMYRDFAVDMHTGIYLTQLMSNADHTDIHCQLIDDMTVLRLDQSSGFLYEFPLTDVSGVFPVDIPRTRDHVVFIQFFKRKIAFVFKEADAAVRFTMCIDLLILRAQQKKALEADPSKAVAPARDPLYGWQRVGNSSVVPFTANAEYSNAPVQLKDPDFASHHHREEHALNDAGLSVVASSDTSSSLERQDTKETYEV